MDNKHFKDNVVPALNHSYIFNLFLCLSEILQHIINRLILFITQHVKNGEGVGCQLLLRLHLEQQLHFTQNLTQKKVWWAKQQAKQSSTFGDQRKSYGAIPLFMRKNESRYRSALTTTRGTVRISKHFILPNLGDPLCPTFVLMTFYSPTDLYEVIDGSWA